MKCLFNMKMSEGGYVVGHLNEYNMVTNQLSFLGVNFDDEVRALLILCSFLEIWNDLVMVVSNSISGSNTLKFDDVIGVILSEEMRIKSTGEILGNALTMERKFLWLGVDHNIFNDTINQSTSICKRDQCL